MLKTRVLTSQNADDIATLARPIQWSSDLVEKLGRWSRDYSSKSELPAISYLAWQDGFGQRYWTAAKTFNGRILMEHAWVTISYDPWIILIKYTLRVREHEFWSSSLGLLISIRYNKISKCRNGHAYVWFDFDKFFWCVSFEGSNKEVILYQSLKKETIISI